MALCRQNKHVAWQFKLYATGYFEDAKLLFHALTWKQVNQHMKWQPSQ